MARDDLDEVNSLLAEFDVTMYRGEDGRYRIWGDINRIQDIVFSPCVDAFPPQARSDLDWFFAQEVDARLVRNLRDRGVTVLYDPDEKLGLEILCDGPSASDMDAAFAATYDWHRVPPDERAPS
ncbi:hypothetical protein L2K70_10920 [Nocardioides KLBMP 9356]|uniref:Uncharacterized protein n=1 Tax=Nocardioides potassii TaxID=2911371 RepID=A0ABS9HC87_9ACTN|nr:hypothetical protein [Nocardioides potassii]MCF6378114.1 hypothetical protein [Nocardioides potassii]